MSKTSDDQRYSERFRTALDLFEAGIEIKKQQFRRDNPGASEPEVQRLLEEWLKTRPGAEGGDAEGKVIRNPDFLDE